MHAHVITIMSNVRLIQIYQKTFQHTTAWYSSSDFSSSFYSQQHAETSKNIFYTASQNHKPIVNSEYKELPSTPWQQQLSITSNFPCYPELITHTSSLLDPWISRNLTLLYMYRKFITLQVTSTSLQQHTLYKARLCHFRTSMTLIQ